MKKLTFSTQITAPRTRVWRTLWDDATYRQWTAAFIEGSHAVSDWREGSKILFLGPSGDGMASRIARLIPGEFMSFEHLGEVKGGVEVTRRQWAGARENYSLRDHDGGTEVSVELDTEDDFAGYLAGAFPEALARLKTLAEAQTITPFLWFDERIEEALALYTSTFPNSKVLEVVRQGDRFFYAEFSLGGQRFAALNGGPMFKFNPSISFFITAETEAEIDLAWEKLSCGGTAMMPLDRYPWSRKYGWVQDRFGLSWQLSWGLISDVAQKFTPSLLFTGEQQGRAEEALNFYTSIFKDTSVAGIARYEAGDADPAVGTVKHAQFSLAGQVFMAMDSSLMHGFQFNEAVSFVVSTETQEETDSYWNALTAGGGQEGQCAWLKDRFGVSWQVVPTALVKYLKDPDPAKANRVMQAMLEMRKIDIAGLHAAYEA